MSESSAMFLGTLSRVLGKERIGGKTGTGGPRKSSYLKKDQGKRGSRDE